MDTVFDVLSPVLSPLLSVSSRIIDLSLGSSPRDQDLLPSPYRSPSHYQINYFPRTANNPLSPREIRELLPDALAAYVRGHIPLSNPRATTAWIRRHKVYGDSFMDTPENVLRQKTGENDVLLDDLIRVQEAICGAFRPSLRETPRKSNMSAPTSSDTVLVSASMDGITLVADPDIPAGSQAGSVSGLQLTGAQLQEPRDADLLETTQTPHDESTAYIPTSPSSDHTQPASETSEPIEPIFQRQTPPHVYTPVSSIQDPAPWTLGLSPLLLAMSAPNLQIPVTSPPFSARCENETLINPSYHEYPFPPPPPNTPINPDSSQDTTASTYHRVNRNDAGNVRSTTTSVPTGIMMTPPPTPEGYSCDVGAAADGRDYGDFQQELLVDINISQAAMLNISNIQEDHPSALVEESPLSLPSIVGNDDSFSQGDNSTIRNFPPPMQGNLQSFPGLISPVSAVSDRKDDPPPTENTVQTSSLLGNPDESSTQPGDRKCTSAPESQPEAIEETLTGDPHGRVDDPVASQDECKLEDRGVDDLTKVFDSTLPSSLGGAAEATSSPPSTCDSTNIEENESAEEPVSDGQGPVVHNTIDNPPSSMTHESKTGSNGLLESSDELASMNLVNSTTTPSHFMEAVGEEADRLSGTQLMDNDDLGMTINSDLDDNMETDLRAGEGNEEETHTDEQDPASVSEGDPASKLDVIPPVTSAQSTTATLNGQSFSIVATEATATVQDRDDADAEQGSDSPSDTTAEESFQVVDDDLIDPGATTPMLTSFAVEHSLSFVGHTDILLIDLGADDEDEEPEPSYPSHALQSIFAVLEDVFAMPTPALSLIEELSNDGVEDISVTSEIHSTSSLEQPRSDIPRLSVGVALPSLAGDAISTEEKTSVSTRVSVEDQQLLVVDPERVPLLRTQDSLNPPHSQLSLPRIQDEPATSPYIAVIDEGVDNTQFVPAPLQTTSHSPEMRSLFPRGGDISERRSSHPRENNVERSRQMERVETRMEGIIVEPIAGTSETIAESGC
ncbi:hypothetical protein QCA50_015148 [Cerrena zonata]|uniref:Uncharacterized protein n=1 Tax=Cerrena zonata TaxID=2478898 RepID=A0AAW0FMA7_9APHY